MRRPVLALPIVAVSLALVISACAPTTQMPPIDPKLSKAEGEKQRELALLQIVKNEMRLGAVGSRLLTAAAPLCGDKVKPFLGMRYATVDVFESEWQSTARRVLSLSHEPQILFVNPGSPADQAGLQSGDVITGFGDLTAPRGAQAVKFLNAKWDETARIGQPFAVAVRRGGQVLSVKMAPAPACDYAYGIQSTDQVNAFADGKRIVITAGMLRFTENDDELAVVFGHELAHNVMGHIDKQMGNRMAGLVIGAIISGLTRVDVTRQGAELGGLAFSQEFEAEADYVGLYYTARAGYGITAAPNFWRRMAVNHPRAIAHGTTHPNTADRFVALEAAAREIDAKRVVGLDLKPEMKMPDFPTAAGPDPGATGSALGVTDPSKR